MNANARIIKSWTTRSKVTAELLWAPAAIHVNIDFPAERNPLWMTGKDDGRGGLHLIGESLIGDAWIWRNRVERRNCRIDGKNQTAEKCDCVDDH
jgi:hypothetical protein